MTALRRLRSGPFSVEDALGVEQWTAAGLGPALMGASIALAHLPAKDLSEAEAADVGFGRSVAAPEGAAGTWRLNAAGRLLALAEAAPGGRLQPKRVFNA